MKKYFQLAFILLISSLVLLACSKSEDPTPAGTSYVSMKINGVEWKSSVGAGAISTDGFSATGALDVTGGKDILVMTLLNSTNVGTAYKFEDTNDRILQFTRQSSKITYFIGKVSKGSSGVLTITKTKAANTLTYANATFSGTAVGADGSKIVITEGVVVNAQVN
jgi:hypothetical protein